MNKLLIAVTMAAALAATATAANATVILNFGQTAGGNTITGTAAGGITTITTAAGGIDVQLTQILGNAVPPGVIGTFTTSLSSVGAATTSGNLITEIFTGSFSIIGQGALAGQNILSGTFTDAAFGGSAGTGLTLTASNGTPGEAVNFTSAFPLIQAQFHTPESINFSFSNVTPGLNTVGAGCATNTAPCTINNFTAAITGTFSGTPAAVPEPASLALLGTALLGLGLLRRRRNV